MRITARNSLDDITIALWQSDIKGCCILISDLSWLPKICNKKGKIFELPSYFPSEDTRTEFKIKWTRDEETEKFLKKLDTFEKIQIGENVLVKIGEGNYRLIVGETRDILDVLTPDGYYLCIINKYGMKKKFNMLEVHKTPDCVRAYERKLKQEIQPLK